MRLNVVRNLFPGGQCNVQMCASASSAQTRPIAPYEILFRKGADGTHLQCSGTGHVSLRHDGYGQRASKQQIVRQLNRDEWRLGLLAVRHTA